MPPFLTGLQDYLLREMPDDGGDGGGAPPPEPAPEPEPTPAASETWQVSREDWEQTQQYLRAVGEALPQLYQRMESLNAPAQATPEEPQYDPFDPESVESYIGRNVERLFSERLQPYEGLLGMVAAKEGETLARTELASLESRIGNFDHDNAFMVASGLIEQGRDPNQALQTAAQHTYEFEQRIRADERARYTAEMNGIVDAPRETVGGATPSEIEKVPTGPDRYKIAVDRVLARRQPVTPTG